MLPVRPAGRIRAPAGRIREIDTWRIVAATLRTQGLQFVQVLQVVVSVIIPVLNEERVLAATLRSLAAAQGAFEVLVVDGDSTDTTIKIAADFNSVCRVLHAARGRAAQMNAGAGAARGDVLLFLHADVRFHPDGILAIERALADTSILGGNFRVRFAGGGHAVASRLFTAINHHRRRFGIFYADSGIFVRRSVFERLGGFAPLSLMEDYEFARRLWKAGRLAHLREELEVSSRRWENRGVWRTMWAWFWIQTFYTLGVPAHRLARWYPAVR